MRTTCWTLRGPGACKVQPEQTTLPLPVVTTTGSITLFRYTSHDVPFWVESNTRAGRWHEVGDPPTQYWSLSPDAAWAELIRSEQLRTEDEVAEIRMPMWACRFPKAGLLDLTVPENQERFGVSHGSLIADSWSTCQMVGQSIRVDHPGVIAPSAALEGHGNVTMFGARRKIDWRNRPLLARTTPAAVVAIGRPPPGLLRRVRQRADPSGRQRLFELPA